MNDKERLQLEEELLMTCSKAQAINKYIDELEESSKLSELWCKSQEENRKLKEVIDKAIEQINDYKIYCEKNKGFTEYTDIEIEAIEPVISKLEDILK